MALAPVQRPVHSGAFETSSDGDFAAGFEDAGRGAEALFVELWIPHAVAIAIDIKSASGGIGADCGMGAERADNGVEFTVVQFGATRSGPLFGLLG